MTLQIGDHFAGYRIEEELGKGGMGVVYRARDLRLPRCVAVKVIAQHLLQDTNSRERFLEESRSAASVTHPHIVPLYAADEHDGQPYIVTQLIDGPDLGALLETGGPLEPQRAVAIVEQVCSALTALHAAGLVHRDVKPANILLVAGATSGNDHAYLTDFGLAKRQSAAKALTATGQFVGTVAYVAPEQITGVDVDGRADIYSLGCVLYQCLTGRVPFEHELEAEILMDHIGTAPQRPGRLRSGLSEELEEVVLKALAKKREERFPSCAELQAAARQALPEPASSLSPPRLLHDGEVRSVAFSPDGQWLATAGDDRTARIWDLSDGTELRRVSHAALKWRGCGLLAVAFDPTGQRIATAGQDNTARVWSVAGGREPLSTFTHDNWVRSVAFTPDGRSLVTASEDQTARVWSLAHGSELLTISDDGGVTGVAVSPDGTRLATSSADRAARVWDLASDRELRCMWHDGVVWAIAISPDGQRLATASADRSARVWDLATGRELRRLTLPMTVWAVAFSPDGQRLATAGDAPAANVWDLADGRELLRVSHDDVIWALAFSPDGKHLATASADGTARVWAV